MSLDSLVAVNIIARTKGVSRAGFGTPLIAHYHTVFPERVRTYSSVQAMIDDGFLAGDAAVLAATTLMAQIPTVAQFKIGRMATTPVAHVEKLVPTATESVTYTIELADTEGVLTTFEYEAQPGDTALDICDAFETAINAESLDITALAVDTTSEDYLQLTGDTAGEVFSCHATDDATNGHKWVRTCTNADPGIATDLAAIIAADESWYGLVVTNPAKACQTAAATWCETNRKLLGITSGDTDNRDGTAGSIMATIKTAAQAHSFCFYSASPQKFVAAGVMGRMFPLNAGAGTWALKTVANAPADVLSDTHKTNIQNAYGAWYCEQNGVNITFPGKTGSGEWIDITHGIDAIKAAIQEDAFGVQVNNEKIGYTDKDLVQYENVIRGVLQLYADDQHNFVIADSIVVTLPKASSISAADKAARTLSGVGFGADLQGAVHTLTIQGTLSL